MQFKSASIEADFLFAVQRNPHRDNFSSTNFTYLNTACPCPLVLHCKQNRSTSSPLPLRELSHYVTERASRSGDLNRLTTAKSILTLTATAELIQKPPCIVTRRFISICEARRLAPKGSRQIYYSIERVYTAFRLGECVHHARSVNRRFVRC